MRAALGDSEAAIGICLVGDVAPRAVRSDEPGGLVGIGTGELELGAGRQGELSNQRKRLVLLVHGLRGHVGEALGAVAGQRRGLSRRDTELVLH